MLTEELKSLSKTDKLLLINELWEDISKEIEVSDLSAEQNQMLDSRYEAFLANPDEGVPWSELKKLERASVNYDVIVRNRAQCDVVEPMMRDPKRLDEKLKR